MFSRKSIIQDFTNRHKILVAATFLSGLLSSLLTVLIPLSIGKFYELALHSGSAKGALFDRMGLSVNSVEQFLIFFLILIFFKSAFTFFDQYFIGLTNEKFTKELRELLFSRQLNQSISTFQSKISGSYLLRYSGDMTNIQRYISKGIIRFISDVAFMFAAIALLYSMSTTLTSIIVVFIVIASVIMFLLGKKVRAYSLDRRNQRSKNLSFVSSRFNAFFTLKAFNRETPESNSFESRSVKLYQAGIKYQRLNALTQAFLPFMFFLMMAAVLFAIYYEHKNHLQNLNKSDVVVFVLLILYMQSPIKRLLNVQVLWQNAHVSFEKLLNILNQPIEAKEKEFQFENLKGKITIDGMDFSYDEGKSIFKNLSLFFQPKAITIISGNQGSGKSTLLKLVLAILQPQNGKIFLDEFEYSNLTPFNIRKQITIVNDESTLIGITVFKAITYSARNEKRDKAKLILDKLNVRFDADDELNLDFKLTENAANISAGQRKLLQIARALITNKKVILLDEPFKGLDDEHQQKVATLLNELKAKRTLIISSNSYPSVLNVDKEFNLN